MKGNIKQFSIIALMALCCSFLFIGKYPEARIAYAKTIKPCLIWPSDGVISDTFGSRSGKHKGIDIAGKLDSPVLAAEDGVVTKSYYSTTYGNVIFIKHRNKLVTVYAHLNKRLVSEKQEVKRGDKIGKMGSSGEATGVHLHFEIHETEWTIDKRYAFNPEKLLGKAAIGANVQGGFAEGGRNVLEASTNGQQSDSIVKRKASR